MPYSSNCINLCYAQMSPPRCTAHTAAPTHATSPWRSSSLPVRPRHMLMAAGRASLQQSGAARATSPQLLATPLSQRRSKAHHGAVLSRPESFRRAVNGCCGARRPAEHERIRPPRSAPRPRPQQHAPPDPPFHSPATQSDISRAAAPISGSLTIPPVLNPGAAGIQTRYHS